MSNAPAFTALQVMQDAPVIPVIVLNDVAHAVPMARALVAGGVRMLEVTLRTPQALACMEAIARDVPEAVVGAGTVRSKADAQAAANAGARFAVSPGYTSAVGQACRDLGLSLLPGVATALGVGAGVALDMAQLYTQGAAAGGPTRTEVLITTTLKSQDRYLAGSADMYYIEQADAVLYLPELPPVAPVPTPVKTWRVAMEEIPRMWADGGAEGVFAMASTGVAGL